MDLDDPSAQQVRHQHRLRPRGGDTAEDDAVMHYERGPHRRRDAARRKHQPAQVAHDVAQVGGEERRDDRRAGRVETEPPSSVRHVERAKGHQVPRIVPVGGHDVHRHRVCADRRRQACGSKFACRTWRLGLRGGPHEEVGCQKKKVVKTSSPAPARGFSPETQKKINHVPVQVPPFSEFQHPKTWIPNARDAPIRRPKA